MFEVCCYACPMPSSCFVADRQREVLAALAAEEVVEATVFARRMRLLAEADQLWEAGPEAFAVLELAGTARIGQGRAARQLSDGHRLVTLFPVALALLETGEMYRESAALLLSLTASCAEAVQAEVGERLTRQVAGLNTTDARKVINRTIPQVEAELDPELTRERLEAAKRNRGVWTHPEPDEMLRVGADLPAVAGRRWALDFEELVRAQKVADREAGVVRTQAQRRADVFAQLPSRVLALITLIQQGRVSELLAAASTEPDLAPEDLDALEALAEQTLDLFPTPTPADPTPADPTADPAVDPTADPAVDPTADPAVDPAVDPESPVRERPSFDEVLRALLRLRLRDPVVINVHIPMTTLLELDHRSGWIDGYGPVSAEHTRLLVPMAGLRQLFVAHDSGLPLAHSPTTQPPLTDELPANPEAFAKLAAQVRARLLGLLGPRTIADDAEPHHDPSNRLAAFVETRDQICLGIGCACSARRSDKDHELRWPEGPTAAWNLGSKSPRCHHAKHTGWDVHRHDAGPTAGTVTWTSPLGHSYTKPGVWTAPTPLPHDVTLPAPRLQPFDETDSSPWEHPLHQEPTPPPAKPDIEIVRTWNDDGDLDNPPF
jgi:hypothetical protein